MDQEARREKFSQSRIQKTISRKKKKTGEAKEQEEKDQEKKAMADITVTGAPVWAVYKNDIT